MSICPACGQENEGVPGNRTHCAGCGSELPGGTSASMSEELARFALTDEEAAEAAGPPPASATTGKACATCGTNNPVVARFCFECGTAFAARPAPAGAAAEALPDLSAEPILEEQPPPFTVTVVVEKGHAEGAAFTLRHIENTLGALGTNIELGDDLFVAPHAATLAFVDDRLVLRDEGSVNGVYVRLRGPALLEPGDLFVAGDHLFRYDGVVDLPWGAEGDTPLLGAPRPQGTAFRVVEVLAGGRTGRTCHRSGSIALGRSGCEMNFPSDGQLATRHAEIRIAEDGSAELVDPGHGPAGVFLRVRPRQHVDLLGGDMLRLGDQLLRVEAA